MEDFTMNQNNYPNFYKIMIKQLIIAATCISILTSPIALQAMNTCSNQAMDCSDEDTKESEKEFTDYEAALRIGQAQETHTSQALIPAAHMPAALSSIRSFSAPTDSSLASSCSPSSSSSSSSAEDARATLEPDTVPMVLDTTHKLTALEAQVKYSDTHGDNKYSMPPEFKMRSKHFAFATDKYFQAEKDNIIHHLKTELKNKPENCKLLQSGHFNEFQQQILTEQGVFTRAKVEQATLQAISMAIEHIATHLLEAVKNKNHALIQTLIQDPLTSSFWHLIFNENGENLLSIALHHNDSETVQLLLQNGFNINAPNRQDFSVLTHCPAYPLITAMIYSSDVTLKYLLNNGAAFIEPEKLIEIAIHYHQLKLIPYLQPYDASFTCDQAFRSNYLPLIQSVFITHVSHDDMPLFIQSNCLVPQAITQGNIPLLEWLLSFFTPNQISTLLNRTVSPGLEDLNNLQTYQLLSDGIKRQKKIIEHFCVRNHIPPQQKHSREIRTVYTYLTDMISSLFNKGVVNEDMITFIQTKRIFNIAIREGNIPLVKWLISHFKSNNTEVSLPSLFTFLHDGWNRALPLLANLDRQSLEYNNRVELQLIKQQYLMTMITYLIKEGIGDQLTYSNFLVPKIKKLDTKIEWIEKAIAENIGSRKNNQNNIQKLRQEKTTFYALLNQGIAARYRALASLATDPTMHSLFGIPEICALISEYETVYPYQGEMTLAQAVFTFTQAMSKKNTFCFTGSPKSRRNDTCTS